ncbi:HNH endonuclease [Brachybacterium alimentarium]
MTMAMVKVYNLGYDVDTGIGELLHTTSVRHAFGMIRREVANPVEITIIEDRLIPTALELTRELSGAWVEGAGQRSIGFSYRAIHERDRWTCTYCGRSVSKTPPREGLLATVDHILPRSRGGESSWLNLVCACKECNNRKADRTPAEAGMALCIAPYDPTRAGRGGVGGGGVGGGVGVGVGVGGEHLPALAGV